MVYRNITSNKNLFVGVVKTMKKIGITEIKREHGIVATNLT